MSYTGWSLRRRGSFVLALVAGLVALADVLFYKHEVGWSVGLFGVALLAAVTLRSGRYLGTWPGRVVLAATLGLTVAVVLEPGPLPITMGLAGLVMLAVIDRGGWTSGVMDWVGRALRLPVAWLTRWARDARIARRWVGRHPVTSNRRLTNRLLRMMVGWALPVVLAGVFVLLFAVANPLVQRWVGDAWTGLRLWADRFPELIAPLRIVFWMTTGAAVWALLRVRAGASRAPGSSRIVSVAGVGWNRAGQLAGIPFVVRCLLLFNLVFAVQTALDLRYLWGGAALPPGMTYAEYAHRGAYPLVVTALLAGAMVLLAFRPGGSAERSVWARRLVGLWIAQNIVLMVSAVWRLGLYVEAYSLTRWRVAAAVWMLLVAVGFVWLVVRIVRRRDNAWLLQRVALSGVALLYAFCFIDVSGGVARFNVRHCAELGGGGGPIDLAYLQALGPAALPAVTELNGHLTARHEKHDDAHRVQVVLERRVKEQLSDWRGWTARRAGWAGATQAAIGTP